jgi:sugar lactone lactonase YvrE
VLTLLGCGLVLGLTYLTAYPTDIDPVAWDPPPVPALTGALATNLDLRKSEVTRHEAMIGPETLAFDAEGAIYGGTHDGKVMRVRRGAPPEIFATTGGRPLGLAFDRDDNLLVADAVRGLLSIDQAGGVRELLTAVGGSKLGFTDDLDIAADGRIYLSDASTRFGYGDHLLDALEGRPNGRLVRYDPRSKKAEVLADELYFANGVALSPKADFALVVETYRFQVRRVWLEGERKGTRDVFAAGLPGYPDGISRSPRGTYWVAMFTLRNPRGDWLAPRPFAKQVVTRLPRFLWPKPERYGLVIELDADGKVLRSLHDPGGEHFANVTSAEEHDGALYLGTLHEARFGRLAL